MASILVVCTGNICRSPMAEAFLRRALVRKLGPRAPGVMSAGTVGWEGSGPMPEAIEAASERGLDITNHVGQRLNAAMIEDADLVIAMAAEHRDSAVEMLPGAASRTYTLKELVRLLETVDRLLASTGQGDTPDEVGVGDDVTADLGVRIAQADAARSRGGDANPWDEDVIDPLGLPLDTYRAVAWELEDWSDRLVDRLFGTVPVAVPDEAGGR
jgi:low molecular weight protein-tyrosine phosphatase